jgi:hypothetical protein
MTGQGSCLIIFFGCILIATVAGGMKNSRADLPGKFLCIKMSEFSIKPHKLFNNWDSNC